jgi:hypothetical protein
MLGSVSALRREAAIRNPAYHAILLEAHKTVQEKAHSLSVGAISPFRNRL